MLDFGLAKALVPEAVAAAAVDASPTMTGPAVTRAGAILGTAAYMSPEQARGGAVDRRTDIWAFGAVLFETLTGQVCFGGDTVTDVLAAVMHVDPDWAKLPAEVPPRLRSLLRRCLAKDRKLRLQAIGDARIELEEIAAAAPIEPDTAADASVAQRRARWASLVAALCLLALVAGITIVLSGLWPQPRAVSQRPLRLSIIHTEGNEVGAPAISPDGTTPFWSPDSRNLGFFAGLWLFRTPADGGPVKRLCIGSSRGGGAWGSDGTILFPRRRDLCRIDASGVREEMLPPTHPGGDWMDSWPSFLPDGRHFLFTAKQSTTGAESSDQGIYLGSLDPKEERRWLLPDRSSAVYAPPGYILFVRDGKLMAVPFDAVSGRVDPSQPVPLEETVVVDHLADLAAISASADGIIAVRPPPAPNLRSAFDGIKGELCLVNRDGSGAQRAGGVKDFSERMALEPAGRRVAAAVIDARSGIAAIWLLDISTGARTLLSPGQGSTGWPVWSPDGTRVAFGYQPPGILDDVYVKDLRTSATTALVTSTDAREDPVAWSPKGEWLLLFRNDPQTTGHLLAYSFRSHTCKPFVVVPGAAVLDGVFSPDGRYVAYSSNESGRFEVSVTTFPDRTATWLLTTEGARVLSWGGRDGHEILVGTLSGDIAAYQVNTAGGTFSAGPPTIVIRDVGSDAQYARATPDHSRILLRVNPEAHKDKGEIRLLFGWAEKLRGK